MQPVLADRPLWGGPHCIPSWQTRDVSARLLLTRHLQGTCRHKKKRPRLLLWGRVHMVDAGGGANERQTTHD
jgi:hypothetical protein